MRFERVAVDAVPVMFVSEKGNPKLSAPIAFQRLEAALLSLQGRKFYATFDPAAKEYRACVALRDGDDAESLGLRCDVIPGGSYLRARLHGVSRDTIPRISETFIEMRESGSADQSRLAVEFYRRQDELDLLLPIVY